MKAVLHQHHFHHKDYAAHKFSVKTLWQKFITWADQQEYNRFLWLAISLVAHSTILTPVTILAVAVTGNVFALLIIAVFSMIAAVVVNLAAIPVKYIVPVFFLSMLIDILIILTAVIIWLSH